MADLFNSHFRMARSSNHTSISKTVTLSLEDLRWLPDMLKTQRIMRFKECLDRRCRILFALDDSLVKKRCKTIHGAKKFYDHSKNRVVQAQSLVEAVVKQNDDVLGISYRLVETIAEERRASKPPRAAAKWGKTVRNPDLETKQDLAFEILEELVEELVRAGHPRTKIWVVTDAWYPSKSFLHVVRRLGVKFMLTIKKTA